ncbi:MAG: DMT family transporter [Bacteroidales bacterium]|nr:DMT family transporter [Bacteroidales bacterium]MBN2764553.1 DMT family transporter [Bacteroidales bacterium]
MSNTIWNNKGFQWIVLISLAFIWGTSFILMKKGLDSFNNYHVAAFRIFFSFVLLLPVSIKNIRKINIRNFKSLLIAGFLGIAIPAVLFTTAQTHISSSLAGILNSLTPFFTLLVGLLLYKVKFRWLSFIGVMIGMVGAAGLVVHKSSDILYNVNIYAILVVIATLCYGTNINEIKSKLSHMTGLEITSLATLLIGPFGAVYLIISDFSYVSVSRDMWLSLLYVFLLALFCSVIALIIFNTLIRYTSAVFSSSVTYIIPIFAIMWGLFDGESLTFVQLVWTSLILIGVYLINRNNNKSTL